MKFSSKVEKCGLSPMRKFHPYAVAAKARGVNIYHLNIGQPDVQTPPAFFEAVRHFEQPAAKRFRSRCSAFSTTATKFSFPSRSTPTTTR